MELNKDGKPFPHDPANRGYVITYHPGETNHCPCCKGTSWHVGRMTATCAQCNNVLALDDATPPGAPIFARITPEDRMRQAQWGYSIAA